ncbi:hypothetical protein ACVWXO_002493 [Bradyrhizobium sp. LM2.7]
MHARAGAFARAFALLQHVEIKARADQCVARSASQRAIGVVGKGDAALMIAQHDQIALLFEQAAGALFGFLQLPIAIDQRFIVGGQRAQPLVDEAQPHAQRGEAKAGEREQKTRADRERVGIVTGILGPAAGNESEGAAKSRREDHERADRERDSGMATPEAAHLHLDPERPTHRNRPRLLSETPPLPCATMSRRPCEQLEALGLLPNRVDEALTSQSEAA